MLSEEEKAIQFYKRFIEAEEQELEWMYKEDEEYYRDSIEQKELLIKGWRNILNLITKLQKENEEKDKQIDLIAEKLAKAYHYKPRECSLKEKEDIDCNKYNDCTSCVKQYFETKAKGE